MGRLIRNIVILCGISVVVFSSVSLAGAVAEDGPTPQVKATIDKVLAILKDPALKGAQAEETRSKKLREVIFARFDFSEMAKRCLGVHWRQRTPQEQKEFVELFSDLLELSYRRKIERYTDEKIIYTKEQVDGKFGVVNTEIQNEREKMDVPIDYKVIRHNGEWKVYDVVIDGISLVSNYRSQFNRIIQQSSYAELVKKMRVKQEVEAELIESPRKK